MGSSKTSSPKIGMTRLAVAPPAVAADRGLMAFLDIWDGRWDDRVGTTLVVERIEGDSAWSASAIPCFRHFSRRSSALVSSKAAMCPLE